MGAGPTLINLSAKALSFCRQRLDQGADAGGSGLGPISTPRPYEGRWERWSLLDWLRLRGRLGCNGVLLPRTARPIASIARWRSPQFTFMLVWVPEPSAERARGKFAIEGRHWRHFSAPRDDGCGLLQGRADPWLAFNLAQAPP